jgi:adenosine deaminase
MRPQASLKSKEIEIDIKKVQNQMQDTFNIPKIELHAHIGGCMRPSTFMELAMAKGADLDKIDFYNVNIATAFEFFKIMNTLVTDLPTL